MNTEKESSRKEILKAAREEFREKGYKGASLRSICKKAGITTGAFYFQFENKEAVLKEILDPILAQFQLLMNQNVKSEFEEEASSSDADEWMVEMIWLHKAEFQILMTGTAGTPYEKVFETLREGLTNGFCMFFEKYGIAKVDPKLLDVLVRMRIESYLAVIQKDYSLEETKKLARQIGEYCDAGFEALVKLLKTEGSEKLPKTEYQKNGN